MLKVLIVDDAAFMRTSLKQILTKNGYNVVGEADNGNSALRKISELTPDIVTMDISMPMKDGIETLKEMKKINKNISVIMISAAGQEKNVREAVISGAVGFILKPFKEELVMNVIKKVHLKLSNK